MFDILWNCRYLPAIQQRDLPDHDKYAGSRLQWENGLYRVQGALDCTQSVEGVCECVTVSLSVCTCVCLFVCVYVCVYMVYAYGSTLGAYIQGFLLDFLLGRGRLVWDSNQMCA